MDDIVERLRARAMRLDWATVPTHELEQAADEIERLREDAHYNKGCCKLAMKHRDEAEAEVERLRGMVRIPLAIHNKDAAEYVERLRKGDIHVADYEPIAELLERQGDEIERLKDWGWTMNRIASAALSQKEGE